MLTPGPPPMPPSSAAGILALTGGLGAHPLSLLNAKSNEQAHNMRDEKPLQSN
jgi:hypothetical protein